MSEHLPDRFAQHGVEACGGLIKNDQVGLVHEGGGEGHAALHATRDVPGQPVAGIREVEPLEERIDAMAPFAGTESVGACGKSRFSRTVRSS
ncbi:MAG: hypothetical protein R2849_04010 [Thermomicrobiales bacterium]